MKHQRLGNEIIATAKRMADDLAHSEPFICSTAEIYNLFLTPVEQQAYGLLQDRLSGDLAGDVILHTSHGAICCSPHGVTTKIQLANAYVTASADPELVERICQWYDRRVELGYLAEALIQFTQTLVEHCPTPAYMYRAWRNASCLFAHTSYMIIEAREEAVKVRPREVPYIPRDMLGLMPLATQATVLFELMEIPPAGRIAEPGTWRLQLPDLAHRPSRWCPRSSLAEIGVKIWPH